MSCCFLCEKLLCPLKDRKEMCDVLVFYLFFWFDLFSCSTLLFCVAADLCWILIQSDETKWGMPAPVSSSCVVSSWSVSPEKSQCVHSDGLIPPDKAVSHSDCNLAVGAVRGHWLHQRLLRGDSPCSSPLKKMWLIYFWRKGVKLHRLSRQEEGHMNGREHLVSFQNKTSPADSWSNTTS